MTIAFASESESWKASSSLKINIRNDNVRERRFGKHTVDCFRRRFDIVSSWKPEPGSTSRHPSIPTSSFEGLPSKRRQKDPQREGILSSFTAIASRLKDAALLRIVRVRWLFASISAVAMAVHSKAVKGQNRKLHTQFAYTTRLAIAYNVYILCPQDARY